MLFQKHESVIRNCAWKERGYTVHSLLTPPEWAALEANIKRALLKILTEAEVTVPTNFSLDRYHHYVTDQALHQQVIGQTRFLTYADLGVDFGEIVRRLSEHTGHLLSLHNPLLEKEIVILRISRPQSLDINPLHRDGYLDLWEDVLNLWIPVAGCNAQSSLPVIPGSHYWNEKDVCRTEAKGAAIGGLRYHVPGIVQSHFGLHLVRPNPEYGEALLFTPFLIHGAAVNQNPDTTRMALELRFYGG